VYGAPPPQFGQPQPQFVQRQQQPQFFAQPRPQQFGSQPQYGAPQQQFGSQPQYGAPPQQQQFGSQPQYGAPAAQQYGSPQSPQQFGSPSHQFGGPKVIFGNPPAGGSGGGFGSPVHAFGSHPPQQQTAVFFANSPPQASAAVGQSLGNAFDDQSFLNARVPGGALYARLAEIRVWASSQAVYGLQCVWLAQGGQRVDGPLHGSTTNSFGSSMVTQSVLLGMNEHVSQVGGRMSLKVGLEAIAFPTNFGGNTRRFGLGSMQASTGQEFHLAMPHGSRVLGFHGTAGPGGLTALGVWHVGL
jgi:hypothetical protein